MSATSTLSHQSSIQATLDVYAQAAPGPAKRASAALQVLLQDLNRLPESETDWQFSKLTGDGFPLEFAFTTADADLRYTTEISSPQIPAAQRLGLACQRLKQLGQAEILAGVLEKLHQIQQVGQLHYGAWVGGRHGVKGDGFKLYAEVPISNLESLQSHLKDLQVPCPRLADRSILLRMIGYHLTSQRLEVYFRLSQAEHHHLQQLMAPWGLKNRVEELWNFLEETYGYCLRGKLPGGSVGISYSLSPDSDLPVFTLFLFARAFWGGDASIRRKLGAVATKYDWDMTLYQQITEPLAMHNTWKTHHGLLGFVVPPEHSIAVSLGVRPWTKVE